MISSKNLRAKFTEKLFSQFKTMKKAFSEINKSRTGYIEYPDFHDIVISWGFDASEELIQDLFNWLDCD